MIDLITRIRGMTEFCDVETISRAVGVPKEIITGVLNGDINEDVLKKYDPARPPEIKIVEKKKYIRSRSVGIVSTGGCGATTLTAALGFQIAIRAELPVLTLDLNEFANLSSVMGIDKEGMLPSAIGWGRGCGINDLYKQHPQQPNLFIIPGAKNTKDYISYLPNKIADLINAAAQNYDIVLVDCPTTPFLWDEIFPVLDMIILILRADEASLVNLVHNFSGYISAYKEKLFLAFNFVGMENNIPPPDYKYFANSLGLPVVAEITESPAIRKAAHSVSVKYPAIEIEKIISEEINNISEMLYSGTVKQKPGILKRLFSR